MAVSIIREGNLPKIKKTCEICNCEFEFDFRDVDKDTIFDSNNRNGKSIYLIDCPCCGVALQLKDKDEKDLKLNLCE